MSPGDLRFPKQAKAHVVGNLGVNAFNFHRPEEWVISEPDLDYGWDLFIEIPEEGHLIGLSFFVQVKSSEAPNYINDNQDISVQLQVSTVNYLLQLLPPSMLAICDTSQPQNPVFWVWIKEALNEIQSIHPD